MDICIFINEYVFCTTEINTTNQLEYTMKTRQLKLMDLVFFYVWEDARVWAYGNYSFDMPLSYLGPVSCAFLF